MSPDYVDTSITLGNFTRATVSGESLTWQIPDADFFRRQR